MPKPLPALFPYLFFSQVGPSIWDDIANKGSQLYEEVSVASAHKIGAMLKYLFGRGGGGGGACCLHPQDGKFSSLTVILNSVCLSSNYFQVIGP